MAPLMAAAQTTKPNVVYIMADDMGLGDVRSYTNLAGQAGVNSPVDTPNIDRIATGGIRFTNAHSPSAVCTPTRYGLLTGQYAWRTPLTTSAAHQKSGVLYAYDPPMIPPSRTTIAEMLQSQGYHTAAFGKWHLGNDWVTTDGQPPKENGSNVDHSQPFQGGAVDNGFDYYFGDDITNHLPHSFIENDLVLSTPSYTQTDCLPEVVPRAMQYVIDRKAAGGPFFLYMPLNAPHHPVVPPTGGVPADPSVGMGAYTYDPSYDSYENFIRMVDWVVGELLDTIEEQGLAGDTIFVFTTDNGVSTNYTDNDLISPGFIQGQLLRGRKADAYEGGHRVPLLVRWDGHVAPGSTSDGIVELNDLYATMVDTLGIPMPANAGEDSVSYLDLLEGVPGAEGRKLSLQRSQWGSYAMRQVDGAGDEWKLIFGKGGGGWLTGGLAADATIPIDAGYDFSTIQMYNLTTDPGEQTNLFVQGGVSAAELTKAQELQHYLLGFIASGQSNQVPAAPVTGGAGCSGISLVTNGLPWLGGNMTVTATGTGPFHTSILMVGFAPLHASLMSLGLPSESPGNCFLDLAIAPAFTSIFGAGVLPTKTYSIPLMPSLAGLDVLFQAGTIQFFTGEYATSDFVTATIGA
ncbi:MAG: arylsulfatase [Planctomycetota bacterium]|nr:arylsulfatase [Planctomycetota bacterium]